MYSILIKNGEKSYTYLCNDDGTIFSGSNEAVTAKLSELMQTYPLGKLSVVHNTVITQNFIIEDVA